MENNKKIIIYDGVCIFCDKFIDFVIRHDRRKIFFFAHLQEFDFPRYGIDPAGLPESIVFIDGKRHFTLSAAIIEILRSLHPLFSVAIVCYAVPRFLRDRIYTYISKRRHLIFGASEACRLPSAELLSRFL